ncbi:hypothetical protein ABSA28_01165 [Candidatus Hepatincolaceae symbiont of Richtersius coronifer]
MAANSIKLLSERSVGYLKSKSIEATYKWTDILQNEHAASFTVAKSTEADILLNIKTALEDALQGGKTLHQFKKELTPLLQEKGWWGKGLAQPINRKKRVSAAWFSKTFKDNL